MKKWLCLFIITFFLDGCKPRVPESGTRLVVFISIDQLRPDLLTRFNDLYTGGFRWLMDHSTWYTNTYHEHARTATGPGHFVLASGQHPGPVGILGNNWYDRDLKQQVYCVTDTLSTLIGEAREGSSYRQVKTTALGDWIKKTYPESKVYSVAGKDRAAVFMGGKNPDLSIWYNWNGGFTTSDYYTDYLPDWLIDFNKSLNIESYKDSLWTRELEVSVYKKYARPDDFPGEKDRYQTKIYSPVFPIGFNSDQDVLNDIGGTPWMENIILNLALTVVEKEKLGIGNYPDLLFIGLSATDWILHDFGPFSQEAMDNQLKVDKYLQEFINNLDNLVGLENILFVLTSDHGGLPLPEYLAETNLPTGRILKDSIKLAKKRIFKEIKDRYGETDFITQYGTDFFYDNNHMKKLSIDRTEIDKIIKTNLETVEGISRVLTKEEILNALPQDTILWRFKNFFHPEKSPDITTLERKYWLFRNSNGTSHNTPYKYDAHVPLLFARVGAKPIKIKRQIATVDIAPTISYILGVFPPEEVDGIVLQEFK